MNDRFGVSARFPPLPQDRPNRCIALTDTEGQRRTFECSSRLLQSGRNHGRQQAKPSRRQHGVDGAQERSKAGVDKRGFDPHQVAPGIAVGTVLPRADEGAAPGDEELAPR
jgi:hypothetical protein